MSVSAATDDDLALSGELCAFIQESPSPFHAVAAIRRRLDAAGFAHLPEQSFWGVQLGGGYYTVRNGSSIIAFRLGESTDAPYFKLVSSHSDSPTLKIKAVPELEGPGAYVRVNVEGYGGLIDRTWLDRPLSVAGRVMTRESGRIRSRLFAPDEDLLLIPSVAIHQDRNVNADGALNRQVDMCPLFSSGEVSKGGFARLLADRLDVDPAQVMAHDLVLVNRQDPVVWGAAREFVSAPRIDDLQCAFAALTAFLQSESLEDGGISVFACFNSEEVGSGTMQGALSTFMPDTLERVCALLEFDREEYLAALSRSFLVSCDNAHAVHPNHPELYDEANRVWLNKGVVLKESAAQRYTTDALSRAVFGEICSRAGVPTQAFANRSDSPGGSTLGNLLMRRVSMCAVDVGLPQLAMHSAYETAGTRDTGHMVRASRAFYETGLVFEEDGSVALV